MVSNETFRQIALSFEEAEERPHFDKASFRVGKKIFATLDAPRRSAVLKLTEVDQSVFCAFDNTILYPVAGAWGRQGYTVVELKTIPKSLLTDALTAAYCATAPKRLAGRYRPQS